MSLLLTVLWFRLGHVKNKHSYQKDVIKHCLFLSISVYNMPVSVQIGTIMQKDLLQLVIESVWYLGNFNAELMAN